ncbi:hypothetical protein J6590_037774 [Homalodisca vitripennis]|nr:hypothetical protein J6590_037774 [Homalodisca vitripennis]
MASIRVVPPRRISSPDLTSRLSTRNFAVAVHQGCSASENFRYLGKYPGHRQGFGEFYPSKLLFPLMTWSLEGIVAAGTDLIIVLFPTEDYDY